MTIYLGSRYENSVVDFITYNFTEGPAPVCFYYFSELGVLSYVEYVWQDGDRIDQLAAKFLSYPDKWWVIAETNPEIEDLTKIKPGTKIRIPRG